MKVIWDIPKFEDPQTGGEKYFKRLKELFRYNGDVVIDAYIGSTIRKEFIRKIVLNVKKMKKVLAYDKKAIIFQNLFNENEYLLSSFILCYLLKRKIILFIHEIRDENQESRVRRWYDSIVNSAIFKAASLIVVNSKFTGDWVCQFGNLSEKIYLMHPLIDCQIGNFGLQKKRVKEPVNILCVGNIRSGKGQIYLLQAVKSLNRDYKITFAGSIKGKSYMPKLERYIAENNMANKVQFKGFLNESQLAEEYQKADIFVLPTLKEGFGLAVLEAMSYGLPVIASNVGSIPELIEDWANGLLTEPANPESLLKAILEILENHNLREQLQLNAIEQFSRFKTVEKSYEKFYEKLMKICVI